MTVEQQTPDTGPAGETVFTVGHSTLPATDFVEILQRYGIETLVDVRTVPRSRRNPQFNTEILAKSLEREGIAYVHIKDLGGLRKPRKDSPNTGWRNESFRGYADYMQTDAFQVALGKLIDMGRDVRVAIMCAEAVPWRCHRSLVADALNAQGIPVVEILTRDSSRPHKLTSFARVKDGHVTYPPEQPNLL